MYSTQRITLSRCKPLSYGIIFWALTAIGMPAQAMDLARAKSLALEAAPNILIAKKSLEIRAQQRQIGARVFIKNPNIGLSGVHNEGTSPTYTLNLSQHFDFANPHSARQEITFLRYQAAMQTLKDEQMKTLAKVQWIFQQAWILHRQKQILAPLLKNEQAVKAFVQKRIQAGLISPEFLTPILADIAQDRATLINIKTQVLQLHQQLSLLTGSKVKSLQMIKPRLQLSSLTNLEEKLQENPLLSQAKMGIKIAQIQHQSLQNHNYIKSMDLSLKAENDAGQKKYGAGITLPFPVWHQNNAELEIKALTVKKSQIKARRLQAKLSRQLMFLYQNSQNSLEALDLIDDGLLSQVKGLLAYMGKRYLQGIVSRVQLEQTFERYRKVMHQRIQFLKNFNRFQTQILALTAPIKG